MTASVARTWSFAFMVVLLCSTAPSVAGSHQFGLSNSMAVLSIQDNTAADHAVALSVYNEPLEATRSGVPSRLRFEVHVSSRKLHVYDGNELMASYPVAVGTSRWPTRRGSWRIYEVVWNPWWHPPDEEWAWYQAIMAPGDPDNPLGRAQLIYDAPRSIHGTNAPESIGKAVSHGSIRVCNETAMKLVRLVMEYAGIERDEEWFDQIRADPSRNVRFRINRSVPIRVH